MINGIHMVDFANHRDTRLLFGKMTALVGQNGAGKTSVMRALIEVGKAVKSKKSIGLRAQEMRRNGASASISSSWPIVESYANHLACWAVKIDNHIHWLSYETASDEPPLVWLPGSILEDDAPTFGEFRFEDIVSMRDSSDASAFPIRWRCRYFKTSARTLQGPSYSEAEDPRLGEDGSDFAWVLANMMTEHPERFEKIMKSMRKVIPIFRRVRSRRVAIDRIEKKSIVINKQEKTYDETQPVMGQELLFDMVSGDSLPASAVSEGTLVTLAILTLVHGSEDVDLIMLDDVELGLHPKAQRDLIQQLRRLLEIRPHLQIIISTHSPYVVDEFEPEDVYLFAPDEEGCAVSARLSDHPDAKRALETLTTGEFWSAEGEEWVLDKSKAREAVAS